MGTTTSFSDQLQDLWRTRPFRLPQLGKVAGVSAGVAQRYQVDPVLVRVAFVVSTIFGGAGVALYLGGWLLFRKPDDQSSPAEALFGRGSSSASSTKAVVLLVAFLIAFTSIAPLGAGMDGSGAVGLLLMLLGWWLLYQRQPVPPALPPGLVAFTPVGGYGTAGPVWPPQAWRQPQPQPYPLPQPHQQPAEPVGQAAPALSLDKPAPDQPAPPQAPPAWDPLGVAPFAWDLPEPTPAGPTRAVVVRPRSRVTPVTLGVALIVTAAASAVAVGTGATWLGPAKIGALALAVVGVGLLVGARRGAGHGLLVVAVPLAGFVVLASLVGPVSIDGGAGERRYAPASVAELRDNYRLGVGSLTLDLRGVELAQDTRVNVSVGFGEAVVTVPQDMAVRVTCQVAVGEEDCQVDTAQGPPDGPLLTLEVSATTGTVQVHRG